MCALETLALAFCPVCLYHCACGFRSPKRVTHIVPVSVWVPMFHRVKYLGKRSSNAEARFQRGTYQDLRVSLWSQMWNGMH